uniref:Uncharacterized protein n=1 Tax=Heterorhabditis bacteriophora TaxID=37862 RepID=A0A1I7XSP7_HETBA
MFALSFYDFLSSDVYILDSFVKKKRHRFGGHYIIYPCLYYIHQSVDNLRPRQ